MNTPTYSEQATLEAVSITGYTPFKLRAQPLD